MKIQLYLIIFLIALGINMQVYAKEEHKFLELNGTISEGMDIQGQLVYRTTNFLCSTIDGLGFARRSKIERYNAEINDGIYSLKLPLPKGKHGFCRWKLHHLTFAISHKKFKQKYYLKTISKYDALEEISRIECKSWNDNSFIIKGYVWCNNNLDDMYSTWGTVKFDTLREEDVFIDLDIKWIY